MNVYADTSALLKVYLKEPSSESFQAITASATQIATSIVTYAEARAGLARALRSARVTADEYQTLRDRFEQGWAALKLVSAEEAIVRLAGDLAELHALRGFDAIHLASAVTFQRALDEPVHFAAADDRLVAAAVASGLLNAGA